ncbi:MAG: cupin domain-containing protein [Dehalococcoidia bacterium]
MERQLERKREAEPVRRSQAIERWWQRLEEARRQAQTLPRVVKFEDRPWVQNAQTFVKNYTGRTGLAGRLTRLPINNLDLNEQIIAPGSKSGKHRHYTEALFFIIEGEGYEMHDEVKYPWKAGDIMGVPTYCIHQHFNPTDTPARFFFCIPNVFEAMGIGTVEQIELHENYRPPEGAQTLYGPSGEVTGYKTPEGNEFRFGAVDLELQKVMEGKKGRSPGGEPRNTYDLDIRTLEEEVQWRMSVPHVVKGDERPWEDTRMGRIKYLVHPTLTSGLRLFEAYIQELPPGGSSGRHRHVGEEVHKILEGSGYDIHDGTRWDWEAEDLVCIPVNTVHQHFNTDPHRPARFLSVQSRLYRYMGHGGVEHLEDTPTWGP